MALKGPSGEKGWLGKALSAVGNSPVGRWGVAGLTTVGGFVAPGLANAQDSKANAEVADQVKDCVDECNTSGKVDEALAKCKEDCLRLCLPPKPKPKKRAKKTIKREVRIEGGEVTKTQGQGGNVQVTVGDVHVTVGDTNVTTGVQEDKEDKEADVKETAADPTKKDLEPDFFGNSSFYAGGRVTVYPSDHAGVTDEPGTPFTADAVAGVHFPITSRFGVDTEGHIGIGQGLDGTDVDQFAGGGGVFGTADWGDFRFRVGPELTITEDAEAVGVTGLTSHYRIRLGSAVEAVLGAGVGIVNYNDRDGQPHGWRALGSFTLQGPGGASAESKE